MGFSLLLILLGLVRTHLEVLDTRVLPLEEALELKIRLSSSRKKILNKTKNFRLLIEKDENVLSSDEVEQDDVFFWLRGCDTV